MGHVAEGVHQIASAGSIIRSAVHLVIMVQLLMHTPVSSCVCVRQFQLPPFLGGLYGFSIPRAYSSVLVHVV